jgi:hypothetical protein
LGRRATVTDVTFLGPQVTDETVDEIVDCVARLRGLDRLTFVESGLTSAGRQRLERQLPHLEIRMIVPVMESIPFPIR